MSDLGLLPSAGIERGELLVAGSLLLAQLALETSLVRQLLSPHPLRLQLPIST
jgi:hypothetical protein